MIIEHTRCPRCRAQLSESPARFSCGSGHGPGHQSVLCRRLVRATNREAIIAVTAREYYEASQIVMTELSLRKPLSNQLTRRCADAETMLEMALVKESFLYEDFSPEISDEMNERATKNAEESADA